MGRRRKRHKHLPPRMRLSHGGYYLVMTRDGKQHWDLLARDFGAALREYALRLSPAEKATTGTVEDMIERYMREVTPTRAPNTQKSYRSWVKPLREVFGHLPVAAITQRMARQYRDRHKHLVSAQRELTLLKTMMAEAVEWGWLDANPLLGFRKKTEGHRKRIFTPDEWARVLEHAGPIRALLRVAMFTAARRSDLLALTWGNVQGDVLRFKTQKTGVAMAMDLDASTREALAQVRGEVTPFPKLRVFLTPHGHPMKDTNLNRYWWKVLKDAGIEGATFHDIRRTRITELGLAYGQEFAQRWAGHMDAKTTAGYFQPAEVRVTIPKEAAPGKEAQSFN